MAMVPTDPETAELLRALKCGEAAGIQGLLDRHRDRLRRMVAGRMDSRLSPRLDPSDVVQDALIQAGRTLPRYLREPRVAVYPWLRSIAWERLIQLRRQHLRSSKRAVGREETGRPSPPDARSVCLVDRLVASGTSPSGRLIRDEERSALLAALGRMGEKDRQVLVMRYLEQRPLEEIAASLGLRLGAVKMRHLRALQRLRVLVGDGSGGSAR